MEWDTTCPTSSTLKEYVGGPGNPWFQSREPQETLSNLLQENRRFAPPADWPGAANVTADAYEQAVDGPPGLLGESRPTG